MTNLAIDPLQFVRESADFIRGRTGLRPAIAIILGSGLGKFAELLSRRTVIDTSEIPHYPMSTVEGHRGNVIAGLLGDIPILAYQGRVHFYESGNLETVLYPLMVGKELGITSLIVTNAAGAVNASFDPGDLMLITDQLNLTFEMPILHREQRIYNPMLYDVGLRNRILRVANKKKIPLRQGVYCGVKGPSYETAAEIRMIRIIGGDVVGMSTVNEVSLAASLGIRVAGISCVTNLSTGISDAKLSHAEVTIVAEKARRTFERLMVETVAAIHRSSLTL